MVENNHFTSRWSLASRLQRHRFKNKRTNQSISLVETAQKQSLFISSFNTKSVLWTQHITVSIHMRSSRKKMLRVTAEKNLPGILDLHRAHKWMRKECTWDSNFPHYVSLCGSRDVKSTGTVARGRWHPNKVLKFPPSFSPLPDPTSKSFRFLYSLSLVWISSNFL